MTLRYLSTLETSSTSMDLYFKEMAKLIRTTANNKNIRILLSVAGQGDIIRIKETWEAIRYEFIDTLFVDWGMIYFDRLDLVLTPMAIYHGGERFLEHFITIEDFSFDDWISLLLDSKGAVRVSPVKVMALDNNTHGRYLVFSQTIPVDAAYKGLGGFLFAIDEEKIKALFEPLLKDKAGRSRGMALIAHADSGEILWSTGSGDSREIRLEKFLDRTENDRGFFMGECFGEKALFSYIRSRESGLLYLTAVPDEILTEQVAWIRRSAVVGIALFVLVGLILSLIFSLINYTPVNRIVESNEELEGLVRRQKPFIQHFLINSIFNGAFDREESIEQYLEEMRIPPWETPLSLVVCEAIVKSEGSNEPGKPTLSHMLFIEKGRELLDEKNALYSYYQGRLALISPGEKKRLFHDELNEIARKAGIELDFSPELKTNSMIDLGRVYREAVLILEYNRYHPERPISSLKGLEAFRDSFYLPMDLEIRLSNRVKAGDRPGVELLLEDLRRENFSERQLDNTMLYQFLSDLRGILIRTHEMISLKDEALLPSLRNIRQRWERYLPNPPSFDDLRQGYLATCDIIDGIKDSHNAELVGNIRSYIETQYSDPMLCVALLAERFSLSEEYLCRFFKEQIGETFSVFLEKLRLDESVRLLADTDFTIEKIARSCGYSSDRAFRRAFKRQRGITPSQFKETL